MSLLYSYQEEALRKMKNGCILCGGVGSGKSRTALAYYYTQFGGDIEAPTYVPMKEPRDLYIITTAKKRDNGEWLAEFCPFLIGNGEVYPGVKVVVDSWNNIKNYSKIYGSFFIFDEQRLVGSGAWVKSFYQIAKKNQWILLSATPGDCWKDYIPVFVANGFYRNKTDFCSQHVIWSPHVSYPKIDRYVETDRLNRFRRMILVDMKFKRETVRHMEKIHASYDRERYKLQWKTRWNFEKDEPIRNASELCLKLREIVNSDPTREVIVKRIIEDHPKVIIFYNYDYELEILRGIDYGEGFVVKEWNGHKHEELPAGNKWVYLVQYSAGAEGWNCVTTDTIIFYSQNYSYKIMEQSAGRIDRVNTPFHDLWYFQIVSTAPIDLSIGRALAAKKNFNISAFSERKS